MAHSLRREGGALSKGRVSNTLSNLRVLQSNTESRLLGGTSSFAHITLFIPVLPRNLDGLWEIWQKRK